MVRCRESGTKQTKYINSMKIKRLSWLDRLFSQKTKKDYEDKVFNNSSPVIQEALKLFLLKDIPGYSGTGYIKHWSEEIVGSMLRPLKEDKIKAFLGIEADLRNLPKIRYTREYIKKLRGTGEFGEPKSAEEYIVDEFRKLRNKEDKGRNKYAQYLPEFLSDLEIEDLLKKIKFLAACLTGQMDYSFDSWRSWKLKNLKINWESEIDPDLDTFMEIIESINNTY